MAVLADVAQGLAGLLRRRPRCLALDALIKVIEVATTNGTAEDQFTLARDYQRKAQFFLDYVVSGNSRSFHAPVVRRDAPEVMGHKPQISAGSGETMGAPESPPGQHDRGDR